MPEFALLAFVMLLALGAWWSMVTFPKQRDFVKRQKFARALAEGDEVVTYGGIIGKVIDVNAETGISVVEIADGVQIRMLNVALIQPYDAEEVAQNAQRGIAKETETE
jgi:preprotein translocase YajC subunit